MRKLGWALALTLAVGTPALAGDSEAQALLQDAIENWRDPDPNVPHTAVQQALTEAESVGLKLNALSLIGKLQHYRFGNVNAAMQWYDRVITESEEVTEPELKKLRADAFRAKGTIFYSEKDDVEQALVHFRASHKTYPTSRNADTLSQILIRIGRGPVADDKRAKLCLQALQLAEEAIDRYSKGVSQSESEMAKFRLQKVIALTALGRREEAVQAWKECPPEALNDYALYQRGVLMAMQSADGARVAEKLRDALKKLFPTPKARNQLRKFIRTEPDFKPYFEREDWKDLVEDEPEAG